MLYRALEAKRITISTGTMSRMTERGGKWNSNRNAHAVKKEQNTSRMFSPTIKGARYLRKRCSFNKRETFLFTVPTCDTSTQNSSACDNKSSRSSKLYLPKLGTHSVKRSFRDRGNCSTVATIALYSSPSE